MLLRPLFIFFFVFVFLPLSAQQQERVFAYGHSLIDHRPPAIPTPSDETTVPHWLYLLAQAAGNDLAAGGKYGFLPQHADQPNISQWGYDIVPGVWDTDTETFAEANITTSVITAGNFLQNWIQPDQTYNEDGTGYSPLSATLTNFDWVRGQSPTTRLLVYENWPDYGPFLSNGFPGTASELAAYHNYTRNAFHDWWIDYHDLLMAARPAYDIKMVPVGPILADILESSWADQLTQTDFYEDDAPHGRATLYFLASLITYPAVYQQPPPANFDPGAIVHQQIRDNYAAIAAFIMAELNAFNDDQGISRVFYGNTLPAELASFSAVEDGPAINLEWSTVAESALDRFEVEREAPGGGFTTIGAVAATGGGSSYSLADTDPLDGTNTYRLRMVDVDGQETYSELVAVEFTGTNSLRVVPTGDGGFRVEGLQYPANYAVFDGSGRRVNNGMLRPGAAQLRLPTDLPAGIYVMSVRLRSGRVEVMRLVRN